MSSQSQRVIALPAGHPLKNVEGLAKQIALPHEVAPLRYPSFPALERTALMGFSQPASYIAPTGVSSKVMLTRQACFPAWADVSSSGDTYSVTYVYGDANSYSGGGIYDTTMPSAIGTVSYGNTTATTTAPGISGANTNTQPILAVDASLGQMPFVYIPANWQFVIVISSSPVNATATTVTNLTIENWLSPGSTTTTLNGANISSTKLSAATNVAGSAGNKWVRPGSLVRAGNATIDYGVAYVTLIATAGSYSFADSTTTQGIVTITGQSCRGMLPLVRANEFSNSALPWMSTRLTAASLLATNVTQVLNKGGTVLAGRVSPQIADPFTVDSSYLNGLHPAEKAFLALETGFYTYAPPSTDLADFWDYTSTTPNALATMSNPVLWASTNYPLYRLDNTSLVNIAFFTPASVDSTFAITVDWHIEFRTTSALFQVGLSTMTLESLHQAQIALSEVGYFFENYTHKAMLTKVISAARKYGPAALSMVPHPAAKAASVILSRAAIRAPPATTLAKAVAPTPKSAPRKKAQPGKRAARRK